MLSIEGLIHGFILAIVWIILAGSIWVAIDNELGDDVTNAAFGSTGRTLINITIMLILPVIIIAAAAKYFRGRDETPPPLYG